MVADARVEAYAVDDVLGVEPLDLGVGVEFVEVGDAQGEVSVGEELHGLGLGAAHKEHGHILLDGPLLDEGGELVGLLFQEGVALVIAHNDARGVEVVVKGLALPQELGCEDDVGQPVLVSVLRGAEFLPDPLHISHGNGRFDDHHGVGVVLEHQLNDTLHGGGVEKVLHTVVIGGGGNHHEVCLPVGGGRVQGGVQVQRFVCQIVLDVLVLDGRLFCVDHIHLLGDDVHSLHVMVLCQ